MRAADLGRLRGAALTALAAEIADPPAEEIRNSAVEEIFDMGAPAIFSALVGWAAGYWASEAPDRNGGFWGIEVTDLRTGQTSNPDELIRGGSDWGVVNGLRFIVARRNGDWDTMRAIFASPPDDEAAGALVAAVLRVAAAEVRDMAGRDAS